MRKLTILTLALLYVVSLAAVSAFAASAARAGSKVVSNKAHMVDPQMPKFDWVAETPTSVDAGKSNESHTALGFFMSPGVLLGTTGYDAFANSRIQRQVVQGADGRVHFVWTFATAASQGARSVHYNSYNPTNGILDEPFDVSGTLDKTPGRFCTVDVFQNRALVVDHYGPTGGTLTTSALDIGPGSQSFTGLDTPSGVVNCQNIYCAGATAATFQGYIWPVAAADQDGTGKLIIHIAGVEGNTGVGYSGITYFRGVSSGVTMDVGMYGTCGTFIDSTGTTGFDIAADPYSDRVVVVYPLSRTADTRDNNDLGYRLSHDLGQNWDDRVNVTKYATGDQERCGEETSVLFTSDNCFHILFLGVPYDSATGGVIDSKYQKAKLYQWSSCNADPIRIKSLVTNADNIDANCTRDAFEYNVCKINLAQCISSALNDTLLYATYTRYLGTTAVPDCSDGGYSNGEVFMSPSSTWGETWGAPVNLTNTQSNGCLAGHCESERMSSSARYVKDTLRIEFLEDLDAGTNTGGTGDQGTAQNSPVRFMNYPCIAMASYENMTCTPNEIKYPFHAVKNATATKDLVLINGGNLPASWTSAVGIGVTVSLLPASGSVPSGYANSATVTATIGPKGTEGLFHNTITFTYGTTAQQIDVPIDFYVFDSWFLPQDVAIRTANNNMMVNQAGQAASDVSHHSFTYFASPDTDYITDASLIMGNSAGNLSWLIFKGGQSPSTNNNYGKLYALSNTTYDTTTFQSYRVAYGKGTNRDSTVGFDVNWYAAKFVDSADFYVGHFEVYKGKNSPTGTVTGLDIAFGCDWDVPSDTSSDNTIGYDSVRQMIYLQGEYSATRELGYGASAAYLEKTVSPDSADADETLQPIAGGFAWGNTQQVYGQSGYQVDSVWNYMEAVNSAHPYSSPWLTGDSIGDMSIVMVVAKNYTVTPTSRLKFDIVLAAKRAQSNPDGLAGLNLAVDQARALISNRGRCSACGDANSDGSVDISDVVYLIAHIFSGGTSPRWCDYPKGKGDANGDRQVDISDAVYLIARIFSGGKAPHCQGK
jgi:hypothetical protein